VDTSSLNKTAAVQREQFLPLFSDDDAERDLCLLDNFGHDAAALQFGFESFDDVGFRRTDALWCRDLRLLMAYRP
jgi:hypothetical protein